LGTRKKILIVDDDAHIRRLLQIKLKKQGYDVILAKDVVGRHCFEVSHGYDQPCDRFGEDCRLQKVFETGEPANCRHEHQRAEGSKFWADVLLSPLKDENGMVTHVIESIRNVTDIIKADEALRESEKRFRMLSESSFEGILIHENAKVIDANKTYADMLGYEQSELIGMDAMRLVAPGSTEKVRNNIINEIEKPYETAVLRKDGSTLIVEINARMIESKGQKIRIAACRDITERKRIEDALRDSQERLQKAQEIARMGFLDWNIKTNEMYWSDEVYEIYGIDPKEKKSNIDLTMQLVHPDDMDFVEKNLDMALKGVKKYDIDHRKLRSDGGVVWVHAQAELVKDADGNPESMLGTVVDITDRKLAEEALKESEEKYRLLFENANDAIFIAQDEAIKFPNPKTEEMTGYTAEELENLPFISLLHPEDKEKILTRHKRRVAGEQLPSTYTYRAITKAGKELWQQLNTVPITWEGNPATLNFVRDITIQKRLETQLQQAQKMEAIGTLAGGIAHDFNNILSPIMIHTQMVMSDLPPDSPLTHNLQEIYQSGERARDLVKQILTFSRQRKKERVPLKMGLILKEVLKLLRASLPSTMRINQFIDSKTDTILADPTQIHQVVMNICANAAHAMQTKGGTLDVRLTDEYLDSEATSEFDDLKAGNYLKLTISDTGNGMEPEIMSRIFEPYYTTKEVGEGTGMGLAVVHGIVKGHDGEITVESRPGKGTTFHILFPKVDMDIVQEIKPMGEIPKGTERILFVDDEKSAVDAVQPMLERLGYEMNARTSSIECLEVFRAKPDNFDLVITDMTMPNMTGAELAKEIMQIRPDIPIILCTGYSEQIDGKKAMQMGIRAYVMKPIIMGEIAQTIREVLDKK